MICILTVILSSCKLSTISSSWSLDTLPSLSKNVAPTKVIYRNLDQEKISISADDYIIISDNRVRQGSQQGKLWTIDPISGDPFVDPTLSSFPNRPWYWKLTINEEGFERNLLVISHYKVEKQKDLNLLILEQWTIPELNYSSQNLFKINPSQELLMFTVEIHPKINPLDGQRQDLLL